MWESCDSEYHYELKHFQAWVMESPVNKIQLGLARWHIKKSSHSLLRSSEVEIFGKILNFEQTNRFRGKYLMKSKIIKNNFTCRNQSHFYSKVSKKIEIFCLLPLPRWPDEPGLQGRVSVSLELSNCGDMRAGYRVRLSNGEAGVGIQLENWFKSILIGKQKGVDWLHHATSQRHALYISCRYII